MKDSGTNKLKNSPRSHNHGLNPGGLDPGSVSLTTKCSCLEKQRNSPASGGESKGRDSGACRHVATNALRELRHSPGLPLLRSFQRAKEAFIVGNTFSGQNVSAGHRSNLSLKTYL